MDDPDPPYQRIADHPKRDLWETIPTLIVNDLAEAKATELGLAVVHSWIFNHGDEARWNPGVIVRMAQEAGELPDGMTADEALALFSLVISDFGAEAAGMAAPMN